MARAAESEQRAPEATPRDALFRKLVWLTIFRLAMVTVLLGGTALVGWQVGASADPVLRPLYLLIGATYAASLVLAVLLARRKALGVVAHGQIALDVALAGGVVFATGGAESIFVFLFSLGIVNGSTLLFRRGAVVSSALAILVYLFVAGLANRVPAPVTLFVHVSAFLATGALAGYLSEQLRTTGERLAAREGQIADITALHASIVQSLGSGLLTLDRAGRITFLNRAGERMSGLAEADVLGEPASRWFTPLMERVPRGETDWTNARGERLRVGFTAFGLNGSGGAEIGAAVIFQDLTDLRAMEEAVRRGERLADLGRMAAGLAHELRNPLAAMTGSVELLRDQAALDGDARRLLDIVMREAARLERLVSRFLRFSRPAPVRKERVDLSTLLDEILNVFANDPLATKVRLERSLASAAVEADPDLLREVVWNLLVNAAQALRSRGPDAGGRIRVWCGPELDGRAGFGVEDDGPGIPDTELRKIFMPFHTTKEQGTGLGLATVQRVVDAHGGSVTVESHPDVSTRFVVRLAAARPG